MSKRFIAFFSILLNYPSTTSKIARQCWKTYERRSHFCRGSYEEAAILTAVLAVPSSNLGGPIA